MAGPTTHAELVDDSPTADLEIGLVVELEEFRPATVDTSLIAFAHDALLPRRRMPMATGCVDRTALSVVDQ